MMPVTPTTVRSTSSNVYCGDSRRAAFPTLRSTASVFSSSLAAPVTHPSVGYLPSAPLFSRSSLYPQRKDTFFPSLASELRQISPRHTFVPLSNDHASLESLSDSTSYASDQYKPFSFFDDSGTPPASPVDSIKNNIKASPTPSVRTAATVDSFESSLTAASKRSPNTSVKRDSLPYIPTQPSFSTVATSESSADMSSLQRALWVPPRHIAVRQLIESTSHTPSIASRSSIQFSPSPSPTNSRKALFSPAREEQDPNRKSRLKTELCLHYINKTQCPFGVNCTYAHGEEELQLTKLMDLHEAGLVDAATYRTVPCLTFVSTGSCPFGKRCHAIHDPRVAGAVQSWLPHTETQGNTIATDINVDALHQKRLYSTLHNNPFGALFTPGKNSFEDLCSLVCNSKTASAGMTQIIAKKKKIPFLEEHHKLSIALKMRGGTNFQFKFRPQHIIYDELCMVLQKRAFRLTSEEAVEIPLSMHNSRSSKDILVREIAFGPDCDASVRGVGLWFGILESDVTVCTPQQAKRYRWKRGNSNKKNKNDDANNFCTTISKFDSRESFTMIRPAERDAYSLVTAILNHRLSVVKADRIRDMCERAITLDRLENKRTALHECFNGMNSSWTKWSWPVNASRAHVDETTSVPPVDGEYKLPKDIANKATSNKLSAEKQVSPLPIDSIWKNFAQADFESALSAKNDEQLNEFELPTVEDLDMEDSRLKVFKRLSEGSPLPCDNESNNLPHVTDTNDGFHETGSFVLQSRRCWKSLLLKPTSLNEYSEWQIVRQHFQNSRSRKVLSILQQ